MGCQPAEQHRVGGGAGRLLQQRQGLLQPLGNAVAQFGRGGLGEGHHQQLLEGELPLAHQPQHQVRQGKGLAGAGTGLQQLHAVVERKAIGIEGLHGRLLQGHDVTASLWSSRGVNSARARSWASGLSSSRPLRLAPKQAAWISSLRSARL